MHFLIYKDRFTRRKFATPLSIFNVVFHSRTSSRGWQLTGSCKGVILDLMPTTMAADMRSARDDHNVMSRSVSKKALITARRGDQAAAYR
jgi:hypothetical protein